jgi:nicotinamidase-related amidase
MGDQTESTELDFDPDRTALIVVDMQNDFCHPDGALYAPGSEDAISDINALISLLDAKNIISQAFLTQDTHTEDDPEFEQWGEHCVDGSWGHAIHDDINTSALPTLTRVIRKDTYDAFHETDLGWHLSKDDIDTVIICGTLVNVCVQETASSANLNGYDVYVVEDAVGYLDEDQKQAALDHIDFLIGDVISVEDIASQSD